MTTPAAPRARAPFPSLLGLGLVLLTMAVVTAWLWIDGSSASTAVCTARDASSGECLLSSQLNSVRGNLFGGMAITTFAGGGAACLIGLVQLFWDRRP